MRGILGPGGEGSPPDTALVRSRTVSFPRGDLRTSNGFCRLSVCKNKLTFVRPKMRGEPRSGMRKGKNSKNMTQFRLVVGPWRAQKWKWLAIRLSLGRKQTFLKWNHKGRPKWEERRFKMGWLKEAHLLTEPQTKKMCFCQNSWCWLTMMSWLVTHVNKSERSGFRTLKL